MRSFTGIGKFGLYTSFAITLLIGIKDRYYFFVWRFSLLLVLVRRDM